jgi:hypothetical protein
MEKYISAESKNALLKLGLYQIIGGSLGLLRIFWVSLSIQNVAGPAIILMLLVAFLFAYSIYGGYLCLKMKNGALMHSYIIQGLQILSLSIMGFSFKFVSGLFLSLGIDLTNSFDFYFDGGVSYFAISAFAQSHVVQIEINLVAIVAFILVDRLNQKIVSEVEIRSDKRFL